MSTDLTPLGDPEVFETPGSRLKRSKKVVPAAELPVTEPDELVTNSNSPRYIYRRVTAGQRKVSRKSIFGLDKSSSERHACEGVLERSGKTPEQLEAGERSSEASSKVFAGRGAGRGAAPLPQSPAPKSPISLAPPSKPKSKSRVNPAPDSPNGLTNDWLRNASEVGKLKEAKMGLNYGSLAKKYAYWLDAGWEPEVLRLMNRLFWKQITLKPGKPAFVQFFGAATKLSNDAARIHKDRSPKDYSGYGPKPSTGPSKLAGWETRRAMGC